MLQHLVILPVLLPVFTAILQLLPWFTDNLQRRRQLSIFAMLLVLASSMLLLQQQMNTPATHYLLGDWAEPFGILLVADQLSAFFVFITTSLALAVTLFSSGGDDEKGSFFHPLLHFQLMGINGAFLTGDLFNLFVFFEVLLISSYGLMIHGGGKKRIQTALHYVLINLVGSVVFLFALALLYSQLGTLHISDMANRIALLPESERWLVQSAMAMLLLVFALKAAMFPLHFWLPAAYSQTNPVVAAMFAVMSKVGIYSFIRVFTLLVGPASGSLESYGYSILLWSGLATMLVAAVMALASVDLRRFSACTVLLSAGTLLVAFSLNDRELLAATLLYAIHSTWIAGLWFMLGEWLARQRGPVADRIVPGPALQQPQLAGWLFALAAIGLVGMPPLSGFVSKVWLLQTALTVSQGWIFVTALLVSSFFILLAVSRAGSTIFWRSNKMAVPTQHRNSKGHLSAMLVLLALGLSLVLCGEWWSQYSLDAVDQLLASRVKESI